MFPSPLPSNVQENVDRFISSTKKEGGLRQRDKFTPWVAGPVGFESGLGHMVQGSAD